MRALKFDAETHYDLWDRLTRGTPNTIVCLVECYFHAVEAPVEVQILQTLGEFEVFLLRAVQLLRHPSLRELDGLLHLGRQALRQATAALVENGLLAEDTSNSLEITARGTAAITSGVATRHERRRLLFHFIHPSNEYVRIHDLRRPTLFDLGRQDTPRGWHWDTTSLLQPMGLPEEWKREREFPLDVVRLITKGDLGTDDTPPDTLDGTNEDSHAGTMGAHQLETFLIVDRAQAGQCAVMVGFEGDSPLELHAYSLTQLRAAGHVMRRPLFSVRGTKSIMRVLPSLEELNAPDRLQEAWQDVARYCGLEDPDRATVRMDEMQVRIGLDGLLATEWLPFCWQTVTGELHICVDLPGMSCLCALAVEPTDELSRSRLRTLRVLHCVSAMHAANPSFIDSPTLTAGLTEAGYADHIDLRELASLAWQLAEFRLAYSLAELEDMIDAHPHD